MPISKAQAFTRTDGRGPASILISLYDQDDAEAVAATLRAPGFEVLTWRELNQMILPGG